VRSYMMAANTLRGAPDTMVTITLKASTGVEYSVCRFYIFICILYGVREGGRGRARA
jgi:hypothetical protein